MSNFHIIAKVKDTTKFGIDFDRPAYVHRLDQGVAPAHADFIVDNASQVGSFLIEGNPLRVIHMEGPTIRVHFNQSNESRDLPPHYELPIIQTPATIHLHLFEMSIEQGPFEPQYNILLDVAATKPLAPCGLDKSAVGGTAAILAVARNPNLTPDQFYRWAQCPWVPALRALANNPSIPSELKASIQRAIVV